MMKIQGGVQNYGWGKLGKSSIISNFIPETNDNSIYAEYWLGTHPTLPSYANNHLLSSITGDLPFLFKILSISKPLSIQIHPNKEEAQILHNLNKNLYPDSNHKPEMCIALTNMKLLIGFKPPEEIQALLETTPELSSIVGNTDLPSQLKKLYENENQTCAKIQEYCQRVTSGVYHNINNHFPLDIGIFFSMFMNYIELQKGQSVIINAGVPHCYLEGDCLEAMACSDNVIRAGLTPKPKDIETLLKVMYI